MSVTYNYNKLKIAVIGCGNWGKNLCRVLNGLETLSAICDIDSNQALQASEQFHVPQATLDKILKDENIHGVFIATPSITHFDIAQACLKANKHTFIEKPFALNGKQAATLAQVATQKQRKLMIGHLLQYHNAFIQLKKLYNDGILGELKYLYANRFNFGKYPNEKSVLWDYAPHDVSMILSLTQTLPFRVTALSANHLQHTHADIADLYLDFAENIKAHISVSWLYPFKEQKLIVMGSKAMAIFEDSQPWDSKLRLSYYPKEWSDGLPHPFMSHFDNIPVTPLEPLLNECRHFLECILQDSPPLTASHEGLQVMTVLDAAELSIAKQIPITLTDFTRNQKVGNLADIDIMALS